MTDTDTAIRNFVEKYRELIEDADALPEPVRSIAEFIKSEVGEL